MARLPTLAPGGGARAFLLARLLTVWPTQTERALGLSVARLRNISLAFRKCGVVVVSAAVSSRDVTAWREALDDVLAPYMISRSRVRSRLVEAAARRGDLKQLWEDNSKRFGVRLHDELLLVDGFRYRERNDARIDLKLPFAAPFNHTTMVANVFARPLLQNFLGEQARLKSLHAIVALSSSQGNDDQHWHRDTELLFRDDHHPGGYHEGA